MELENKIAIVTGASRGIGRAVAFKYAAEGAKVVAVARDSNLLDSLLADIAKEGGQAVRLKADITDEADCRAIIDHAVSRFGRLDILVNNAGLLGSRVETVSVDTEEWKKVFETNVTGTFMLCKFGAEQMKTQKSGSIINLTSGVVRRPQPEWGAYLPSKFAVEGLTLMLAEELRQTGVRVNLIDPGRTDTDMIESAFPDVPRGTYKSPDDIVDSFVFLGSDESRLITGTRISII